MAELEALLLSCRLAEPKSLYATVRSIPHTWGLEPAQNPQMHRGKVIAGDKAGNRLRGIILRNGIEQIMDHVHQLLKTKRLGDGSSGTKLRGFDQKI